MAAIEFVVLALAWAAALAVQPWRLLRAHEGHVRLATPLLASLAILPWLWAWPGLAALPIPLHWSAAPLVVLLLGWPLAVPVLTFAGLSTLVTVHASPAQALALTVWSGVLPATLVLALGHAVRKLLGPHPLAYMLGRAFFVPMVALGACALLATACRHAPTTTPLTLERVAIGLLSLGEASWTCAVVSLLVACRPRWLATWSESLYLGRRPDRPRLRPHR
jgi:uncharacterized membrane protein